MSESEGTYSVWTASALIFNAVVGMGIWTVPKESFIANQSRDLALSYISYVLKSRSRNILKAHLRCWNCCFFYDFGIFCLF